MDLLRPLNPISLDFEPNDGMFGRLSLEEVLRKISVNLKKTRGNDLWEQFKTEKRFIEEQKFGDLQRHYELYPYLYNSDESCYIKKKVNSTSTSCVIIEFTRVHFKDEKNVWVSFKIPEGLATTHITKAYIPNKELKKDIEYIILEIRGKEYITVPVVVTNVRKSEKH